MADIIETPAIPFALPERIDAQLETLRRYWSALKRAQNTMPFADDLRVDQFPQFAPSLLVIEVRETPERFRFDLVGAEIERRFGEALAGRFLDEVAHRTPIDFLASQCSALMQTSTPTWFASKTGDSSYERLLLPFWGNGYVSRIAGAYVWRTR